MSVCWSEMLGVEGPFTSATRFKRNHYSDAWLDKTTNRSKYALLPLSCYSCQQKSKIWKVWGRRTFAGRDPADRAIIKTSCAIIHLHCEWEELCVIKGYHQLGKRRLVFNFYWFPRAKDSVLFCLMGSKENFSINYHKHFEVPVLSNLLFLWEAWDDIWNKSKMR